MSAVQATRQYNTKTAYRKQTATKPTHLHAVGSSDDFKELKKLRQAKIKQKKRAKLRRKIGIIFISVIVMMLACAVAVGGFRLTKRNEKHQARIAELEKQIAAEEQRALDLKEYSKYVQTDMYIEEIARDKLVYMEKSYL